ncbi:MAG TPA: hypothetical protein VFD36_25785 [Kofleriaceae bacterium]|nr:hypothetical protein [Kofleriaceae bacterium]
MTDDVYRATVEAYVALAQELLRLEALLWEAPSGSRDESAIRGALAGTLEELEYAGRSIVALALTTEP